MSAFGLGFGLSFGGGVVPPAPVATAAPVNTVAPAISGVQTVGQTLSVSAGAWDQPYASLGFQWRNAGVNIAGATAQGYVIQPGDAGDAIDCVVTATNSFGSGEATAAAVTPAAALTISGSPATTATVGSAYSFTPTTAGGHTPKSFSISGQPAWAAFSTATGQLTGTPGAVETDNDIVIGVTDADGLTAALPAFSITVSASTPSYPNAPYVAPGALPATTTTATTSGWALDSAGVAQGTSGQEGYGYIPAGANWACGRFQDVTLDAVDGDLWIGAVAAGTPDLASYAAKDDFCNMLGVEFAVGGGAYVRVTTPSVHPITGKKAFWARIRIADLPSGASSGLYEVRARCIPQVGQPYMLQGPDPAAGSKSLNRVAQFSNYVVLDKGDLVRQAIYKAPNDGTAAASDVHAGTAADPCVTWERARALHRAHPSYPTVITTYYLTSASNHEWGLQSGADDAPVESTLGWTRHLPAPGATVAVTRWTGAAQSATPATLSASANGRMPARKFWLASIDLGDVSIDNTLYNAGWSTQADGYYNNTALGINSSFHSHVENITFNSRSTALGASGTMLNQPLNPDWFNHGNSALAVEFASTAIAYSSSSGLYQSTFLRDCTLTHIADYGDMADNCRYVAGLRIYAVVQQNMGNHLDVAQPTQTASYGEEQAPFWCEDLTILAADGYTDGQGELGDSTDAYHNAVSLRLHADCKYAWSNQAAQKNNRILWPNTKWGVTDGIVSPTYTNAKSFLSAPDENTFVLLDSAGAGLYYQEFFYRKGVKLIYPFTTVMPNPGLAVPTSPYDGLIPSSIDVYAMWDVNVAEFSGRIHHDDSWNAPNYAPTFYPAGTVKCRGLVDAFVPQLAGRTTTGVDLTSTAEQLWQLTDSARPLVTEGAYRKISFSKASSQYLGGKVYPLARIVGHIDSGAGTANGDDIAGTVLTVEDYAQGGIPLRAGLTVKCWTSGSTYVGKIVNQVSGTTGGAGVYTLDTAGLVGWNTSHVLVHDKMDVLPNDPAAFNPATMTLAFCLPNIGAVGDTSQHYFYHCGRTSTELVFVGTQKQSAWASQRLVAQCGKTDGVTPTFHAMDTGAGCPAVTGATVVFVEIMSDRLRTSYWNAATEATPGTGANATVDGKGYQVDSLFGSSGNGAYSPYHAIFGGQGHALAASDVGTSGFADMDFTSGVLTTLMDATTRANVLAEMKGRLGLA